MTDMTTVGALELAKEIAETALGFWSREYTEENSDAMAGDLLHDEDVENMQKDYLEDQIKKINNLLENLPETHVMRTRDEIMSDIKATGQVGNALVLEVLLDIRDKRSRRHRHHHH